MTTLQLKNKCLRESAEIRESIYETAILEDADLVKSLINDAFRIICKEIFTWMENEFDVYILNQDKINEDEIINLLYWNKDGKNIEERINNYFLIYATIKDSSFLLSSIEKLIDTEIINAIHKIPKNAFKKLNINALCEIFVVEGCDECQSAAEYGAYPPYHPRCQCCGEWRILDDYEDEYDIDTEELLEYSEE